MVYRSRTLHTINSFLYLNSLLSHVDGLAIDWLLVIRTLANTIYQAVVAIHGILVNLHPDVRASRNGLDLAQNPVDRRGNDESTEEVQVVKIGCADWNWSANCTSETDYVDQNTSNVRGVCAPADTPVVKVWAGLECRVEVAGLEETLADEVVVGAHDAGDAGEEDGVGGQVGGEAVAVLEQVPGLHDEADGCANVRAAADVEPSWGKGSHVCASGDGVGSLEEVLAQLDLRDDEVR